MIQRKFSKAGDVLPAILKKLGLEQRFKEQQILSIWPSVVGMEIASRTRATRIEKGTLYVHVEHGAWMQELHFIEKELLGKLRERAPGVKLNKIRFSTKDQT